MTSTPKQQRDRYAKRTPEKIAKDKQKRHQDYIDAHPNKKRNTGRWNSYDEGKMNFYYMKNYGISLAEYNDMFSKQGGKCLICGKHQIEMKKKLHVDHDHKTGYVRGLLCHNCNAGLGNFHDKPNLIERALEYLRRVKP